MMFGATGQRCTRWNQRVTLTLTLTLTLIGYRPALYKMEPEGNFGKVAQVDRWFQGSNIDRKQRFNFTLLDEKGTYLLDTGFHVYYWIGGDAPKSHRSQVNALFNCQKYLKDLDRPPVLPITRIEGWKIAKSRAKDMFNAYFFTPEDAGCGCVIV